MSSLNGDRQQAGKTYWRSLNEFADTPEFREAMHREFPASASELLESDRRQFLKIMGASIAFAGIGLSGCRRWPREEIAPFAKRPSGVLPGIPEYYASSMELGGVGSGLLVTSTDGRPTKIEGNPEHPFNNGATNLYDQASVLDMYDPDRSWEPRHNGEKSTTAAFQFWADEHSANLRQTQGNGLRILSEATSSPSAKDLRRRLMQKCPQAVWHEYEPLAPTHERDGLTMAFGTAHRVHHTFSKAMVVVALDSDFLGCSPAALTNVRGFAISRSAKDDRNRPIDMSRLYCYEPMLSLTGSNADERKAVRAADVPTVAAYLAAAITNDASLRSIAEQAELSADLLANLDHAVEDLKASRGGSIVIAGPRQPAAVHYLAAMLNQALGNVGATVSYTAEPDDAGPTETIASLTEALNAGDVDTLVIIGGNPVYDAPADLNFAAAMAKAATVVHLSSYPDETSTDPACTWHMNRAHWLESWGDTRTWDGTYTIRQPLIRPLFDGMSDIELLARLAGDVATDGQSVVKRTFSTIGGGGDWRATLHDGFIADSQTKPSTATLDQSKLATAVENLRAAITGRSETGYEVVFVQDTAVYDGRFANNGWLQELPDPITKLTWDNAAILGVNAAQDLGVDLGDMISITAGGTTIEMPVIVMPGQSDESVAVALGYGRTFNGRIAKDAGVNVYPLRTTENMAFVGGAAVENIGSHYPLASTQDHHTIDPESTGGKGIQKRLSTLVREATLKEYRDDPKFAKHRTHVTHRLSLFAEDLSYHDDGGYGGSYAWGMSIDLNKCVGCSACVIACQAENNIPIVGKDQVLRGREMHWLRIDRYFAFGKNEDGTYDTGNIERVALQPMACVHCENAPCEQVCPVAATVHDSDGLNVMVYNRCIGTRYCSNNCPYKVRRFNYFDFHERKPHREQPGTLLQVDTDYYSTTQADPGPLKAMQFNPEVTVRSRGVMEKCTYCVQRIQKAKIQAKNDWVQLHSDDPARLDKRVPVADGAIQTACQQACPAQAIMFGDLKDNDSQVMTKHRDERAYDILEELNTKPRTKYLAKIRNPINQQYTPSHRDASSDGHKGSDNGDGQH